MAKDDVDIEVLLAKCERSMRYLGNQVELPARQYLLAIRNALADPSGEDREEAIRNLRLLHEHMAAHVGGDFTLPTAADPPALQAVRELRRRMQRDKVTRRRRASWVAGVTLGVAILSAVFGGLAYFCPRTVPTPPPVAPGLEQPAPQPLPPAPGAPAPSVQPPPATPR